MEEHEINEPQWELENVLTTPSDRVKGAPSTLNMSAPPLTDTEFEAAKRDLDKRHEAALYPRVQRGITYPPVPMQEIGLTAFVPAKGARPNKDGVYGFAVNLGNFPSVERAGDHADEIIRFHDSYSIIRYPPVGHPYPITTSSSFSSVINKVDIREEACKAQSEEIRRRKREDAKKVKEIQDREKNLLEESRRARDEDEDDETDPLEFYITLRVKKAQLIWAYLEHQKKIDEIKNVLLVTREEIDKMHAESSEYEEKYMEQYMAAREEAGLPTSTENNFMQYLCEDLEPDLGF